MKLCKTEEEFVKYMWEIYPDDNQLDLRIAMLKTFNFLVGRYDFEEQERLKISEKIGHLIDKKFGSQKNNK